MKIRLFQTLLVVILLSITFNRSNASSGCNLSNVLYEGSCYANLYVNEGGSYHTGDHSYWVAAGNYSYAINTTKYSSSCWLGAYVDAGSFYKEVHDGNDSGTFSTQYDGWITTTATVSQDGYAYASFLRQL